MLKRQTSLTKRRKKHICVISKTGKCYWCSKNNKRRKLPKDVEYHKHGKREYPTNKDGKCSRCKYLDIKKSDTIVNRVKKRFETEKEYLVFEETNIELSENINILNQ